MSDCTSTLNILKFRCKVLPLQCVKLESFVADFHLGIDHFPNERHLLQEKVLTDVTIVRDHS